VAPTDSRDDERARAFLDRCTTTGSPVRAVHYLDVRQSMHNGGGPACLRLRVPLTGDELAALGANVVLTDALLEALGSWVDRHYRDRLVAADLADPALVRESMRALDELTQLLGLGSIYDYQGQPELDPGGDPP
jgi:succinylarginine dihydrolase